jgi:hypothetical protein
MPTKYIADGLWERLRERKLDLEDALTMGIETYDNNQKKGNTVESGKERGESRASSPEVPQGISGGSVEPRERGFGLEDLAKSSIEQIRDTILRTTENTTGAKEGN